MALLIRASLVASPRAGSYLAATLLFFPVYQHSAATAHIAGQVEGRNNKEYGL